MEKTRIEALRETLLANPDAAFVRYALAMELSNAGHSDEAWPHFEYLLNRHPEYSATYFHAAKLLAKVLLLMLTLLPLWTKRPVPN